MIHPRVETCASQMLAVVLAGGRGTRLQALTQSQAKPALHFGGFARLIDFPLSNCVNSGIRRIAVATQFCPADLYEHIQRAWSFLPRQFGEYVDLWPASERDDSPGWYAGTADAVRKNLEKILKEKPEYVLILAGDHVYKQNYAAMLSEHIQRRAEISIACVDVPRKSAGQFGCLEVAEDDRVQRFLEKPIDPPGLPGAPERSLASMGIYIFNTEILISALNTNPGDVARNDFGHDVIPAAISSYRVYAHRFEKSCVGTSAAYWKDVGTLDEFWRAHMDMLGGEAPDLLSAEWPIYSDRRGAGPARFRAGRESGGLALNSIVGAGCKISGMVRDSILFHDVEVGERAALAGCVVMPGAYIENGCRLENAIVAPGTYVHASSSIEHDPRLHVFHTGSGVSLITNAGLALSNSGL
jgi:glucose-1-phosphate adenylyltransferase